LADDENWNTKQTIGGSKRAKNARERENQRLLEIQAFIRVAKSTQAK